MTAAKDKNNDSASDISHGQQVPADPARDGDEDPRARAERLGQADVVNPNVPTGQDRDQMIDELQDHNSNEQLRVAADKRRDSEETAARGGRSDERGFTTR